jgi:uncharacterized protein
VQQEAAYGYPGSTYTLTDDPTRDQLEESYVQAALQPRIDVMFVRMKSGGIAPSRLRLTHSDVLAECIALASARRLPRGAALTFVIDLVANPDSATVWVDEALHLEALALLIARQDQTSSLCDAVSFVLMRQRHLTEALTTDRPFEPEGFQRLLVEARP